MFRAAQRLTGAALQQRRCVAAGAATAATILVAAPARSWLLCADVPAPQKELFKELVQDYKPLAAESEAWQEAAAKSGSGYAIQVRTAPSSTKGLHARRYRLDIHLEPNLAEKADVDAAFRKLMCPKERMEWDKNLSDKEFVIPGEKVCPEEKPEVVRLITAPAGGGLISAREFLDARLVLPVEGLPGKVLVSRRWDDKAGLPASKGTTRAYNVQGCSFIHICKDTQGAMHITMFGQSEIGGWIPVSVVNAASSNAYVLVATGLMKSLGML